jgi:hypothetical protein
MDSLKQLLIFEQMVKILLLNVSIQIYNSDIDNIESINVNNL